MGILFANSLLDGFLKSNFTGKGIVLIQIALSVLMFSVIIKKWLKIAAISSVTRRFLRDFGSGRDVLDYYLQRRKSEMTPLENIYVATCERLLKLLSPDVRSLLMGRTPGSSAALSAREIELVRATCEHTLDEEEIGRYVQSGDPLDKAGAYGIQSGACVFVRAIRGDYFNVVGLPVCRVAEELKRLLRN